MSSAARKHEEPVLHRATYNRPDPGRNVLIGTTWLYFAILILLPIGWMIKEAVRQGPRLFIENLSTPEASHSFVLTALLTLGAVVINTFFGVIVAYVLVRQKFWGKSLLNGLVDLPFALSPVIAGFMLILLFGPDGWLGPTFQHMGLKVVFSFPGMLLATLFVTLPFVIREVGPVMAELGREQEDAAITLGAGRLYTFFTVTLPSIKWGLLYGVTLTIARAIGEFGAVLVVSGNIIRQTQTATLFIHQSTTDFDMNTAFAAATVLALISFLILLASELVRVRSERSIRGGRPDQPAGGNEAPIREYLYEDEGSPPRLSELQPGPPPTSG